MPTSLLKSQRTAALVPVLASALLSGCATGPAATASGTWQDKAALSQPFARVIVVGVSADLNQRCRFERVLASRIDGAATKAVASCDVVAQKDPLTRASIEAVVAELKADGVLATTLVSFEWDTQTGGSRDTRGSRTYKPTDAGWDVYGVPVVYGEVQNARAITTMEGEASVVTKAWSTRGPTLAYTMNSTVRNFEASDQGLITLVGPMVERLKRDGVIR